MASSRGRCTYRLTAVADLPCTIQPEKSWIWCVNFIALRYKKGLASLCRAI